MGFRLDSVAARLLLARYTAGKSTLRCRQEVAIRAAPEMITRSEKRALLLRAIGTGETSVAVSLLTRIANAGQLRRAHRRCLSSFPHARQ